MESSFLFKYFHYISIRYFYSWRTLYRGLIKIIYLFNTRDGWLTGLGPFNSSVLFSKTGLSLAITRVTFVWPTDSICDTLLPHFMTVDTRSISITFRENCIDWGLRVLSISHSDIVIAILNFLRKGRLVNVGIPRYKEVTCSWIVIKSSAVFPISLFPFSCYIMPGEILLLELFWHYLN